MGNCEAEDCELEGASTIEWRGHRFHRGCLKEMRDWLYYGEGDDQQAGPWYVNLRLRSGRRIRLTGDYPTRDVAEAQVYVLAREIDVI